MYSSRSRTGMVHQSAPSTSPPFLVHAACHVSSFRLVETPRTEPSHIATWKTLRLVRGPAMPPSPPQSASGLGLLGVLPAVSSVCRYAPSIHDEPRSPMMLFAPAAAFLPSGSASTAFTAAFHSLTPASSLMP